MKIAINARLVLPEKMDGMGWFAYQLLKRLPELYPQHEFIYIFDRKPHESLRYPANVKCVVLFPPTRHPWLWKIFFEHSIPGFLKKSRHRCDLFISTDGWMPLKLNIPCIDVIHDINFEHYPEFIQRKSHRKYYLEYFRKFAQRADVIATVSQYSKQDIAKTYQLPPEKIEVIYNGINEGYRPLSAEEIREVRDRYAQGCPYFIFVGSMHPRKNLANIFRGFDRFKQFHLCDTKLVLAGDKSWFSGEDKIVYQRMKFKDEVFFLGRLPNEELPKVLGASIALVYPSYFEGFGLPILEAFWAEVPVITSKVTAMSEVGGDAVCYVNPFDYMEIYKNLEKIHEQKDCRNALIEKARQQRTLFTWDKVAESLGKIIERFDK